MLDNELCAAIGASPIKHVNLIEIHLHWGGIYDAVQVYKATDVLAWLRQCQVAFPRGARIGTAVFDVFVFGEKRPRRVTIVPPNVARYSHEDQSHMIDRWLGLRGFIPAIANETDEHKAEPLLQGH